jgi:hypothetical protein
MNYLKTLVAVFIPLLFLHTSLYSQKQPKIKFGQPIQTDLEMTKYERDTSASAVILYKKGYFKADDLTFQVHVRVKVLKSTGLEHANFTLHVPSKSSIDGRTYNLENGAIVTTKLEKANVFKESVTKDYSVYKVFFPNVKAGSVVDLQYSHESIPNQWWFQDVIPVVYNELTLEPSQYLTFKKTMYGFQTVKPVNQFKWVAENFPAIVKEPYMPHYSNYVTQFKFDLESFQIPGRVYQEFSTNWKKVAELHMEDEFFGGVLKGCAFLNDKAKELKESNLTIPQKIDEAYKYIRENIKWNGNEGDFASEFYRDAFKNSHTGNAADVNLMLIALLKKADITAHPVLMSTRSNGLLNQFSASLTSLDYVICYVEQGDVKMFLDACMRNGRPGILPKYCLNLHGLAIDNGYFQWLDLTNTKTYRKKQYININVAPDGEATADVTSTFDDYAFLEWMELYNEQGEDEQKMKNAIAGADAELISEYKVTNVDKTKLNCQDKRSVDLAATEYFQQIGNEYIVTPFVMVNFENPFNAEKRLFPIDFTYPMNRQIIVSLALPDNMTIKELPKSVTLKPENGGAKFTYLCNQQGNKVMIKADLIVEKQLFSEGEYLSLKNFFSEVHKLMGAAIQLDKKI